MFNRVRGEKVMLGSVIASALTLVFGAAASAVPVSDVSVDQFMAYPIFDGEYGRRGVDVIVSETIPISPVGDRTFEPATRLDLDPGDPGVPGDPGDDSMKYPFGAEVEDSFGSEADRISLLASLIWVADSGWASGEWDMIGVEMLLLDGAFNAVTRTGQPSSLADNEHRWALLVVE